MSKPLDVSTPKSLPEALELIEVLTTQVQSLTTQVEHLSEQLEESQRIIQELQDDKRRTNSRNSSKSPSSDSPEDRKSRHSNKKPKASKRKRGAQPGHPKHERELVDQVDEYFHIHAHPACPCGGHGIDEPTPHRHQIFDIPPHLRAWVIEYQLHHKRCQSCGKRLWACLPSSVQSSQMGPGLLALIAELSGRYRMSVKQIQHFLGSVFTLPFSTGAISQAQGKVTQALGPIYTQVQDYARSQEVGHADETTHWRSGERRWMWVLSAGMAVFFMTHYSRGKAAAARLLGEFSGYLVTDNYSGYNDVASERRQLCWAHLIRHCIRLSEYSGEVGKVGRRLLRLARFSIHIDHRWRADPQNSARYIALLRRCRAKWIRTLRLAVRHGGDYGSGSKRLVNQCKHLLKVEPMYWTFMQDRRVAMTNNEAERVLRGHVIWRKVGLGTWSARGDQFRATMLSVTHSAARLGINSYALIRQASAQWLRGEEVDVRLPFGVQRLPEDAS